MTRRLSDDEAAEVMARAVPLPEARKDRRIEPRALRGVDPNGTPCTIPIRRPTLVLFVSTSCEACHELADLVREGVDGFTVIGALREPAGGVPEASVRAFVGDRGTWLLGDDAFSACRVTTAPFFCVLGEHGDVLVEGVGFGRTYVEGHCDDVRAGVAAPDVVRFSAEPS